MNRKPPVYASLFRILIILVTVCAPLMARATTTATPAFSLTAGTYTGTQTVAISDSTSGSTIYYTTNGATPTTSSTKYTGSITVSTTESLKAIATANERDNPTTADAIMDRLVANATKCELKGESLRRHKDVFAE